MGKLEKVIVLSVLFVIAVILVVSLTTDNPIDKKNVSVLGQPTPKVAGTEVSPAGNAAGGSVAPGAQVASAPGATPTAQPAALLNSSVTPGATPATTTPAAPGAGAPALSQPATTNVLPQGSILLSTDGLSDSYLPDMKFYTWQPGDTFRGVANTYYGDWQKLTLLRRANEGRKNVQPGEKILVPVFDLDAVPGVAAPAPSVAKNVKNAAGKVTEKAATDAAAKKGSKSTKANDTAVAPSGGGKIHVVKEGESLWKIAKAELGNGALWEKIYQANKDVMKSPEALKTGMKLKIP
ncbi:MAG: LysM peptidoglycan-binding domain-containing protein [Planctomycetes bacterium]|nr:LysM peptidoglycan-binding domain-containing protein [Planctomycetota bacterium]